MNIFLSELSSNPKEKDVVRRLKLMKIVLMDDSDEIDIISRALDLYLLFRKREKKRFTTLKEQYWRERRIKEFEQREIDDIIGRMAADV